MKTSPDGLAVMHYFESCRLEAYPDPATGGEPITIGWGTTYPGLKLGTRITQAEADMMFADRLAREFEPCVNSSVNRPMQQRQFDALVCLTYNIGCANFRNSTLLKRLNSGDVQGASAQFLVWNKAGGKVMLGLQRRRTAERALFDGMSPELAINLGRSVQ